MFQIIKYINKYSQLYLADVDEQLYLKCFKRSCNPGLLELGVGWVIGFTFANRPFEQLPQSHLEALLQFQVKVITNTQLKSVCTIISGQGDCLLSESENIQQSTLQERSLSLLRLLVLGGLIGRTQSFWEEVIMTRNMAVPRQIVWILDIAGVGTTAFLDHTDCGL